MKLTSKRLRIKIMANSGAGKCPGKEGIFMVKSIDITSHSQVERISDLASKAPYEVWLSDGTVMLDARSLLGLFALIGKRVNVVVGDRVNPADFNKLVNKMVK